MTKTVTSQITTALAAHHWEVCLLIKMFFDSGTVYATTAGQNITWSGNTYIGVGAAGRVEPIRETALAEVVGLSFTIAGPISAYLAAALTEDVQNRRVEVYFAMFQDGVIIPDPVLEWAGNIDTMTVVQGKENDFTITVTAENRFVLFARPRLRRHNMTDHQTEFPGDTFYQYLPEMMEKVIVWPSRDWGKQG